MGTQKFGKRLYLFIETMMLSYAFFYFEVKFFISVQQTYAFSMCKQSLHAANIRHEGGEFQIEAWLRRWSRRTNFK